LFFLLSNTTTFSEDDDQFRSFFQKRYDSIDNLRTKLEETFNATMSWLLGEVFSQPTRRDKTEVEIQQDEFEEEYARDMMDAVAQSQR